MLTAGDGVPVCHATNNFLLTVSISPSRRQLRDVLHDVLTNPHPRYRHVIYSGLALSGSGCWLLRDGPFICDDFVAALVASKDVQNSPLYVGAFDEGRWTPNRLSRAVPDVQLVVNPDAKCPSPSDGFMESLSRRVGVVDGGALLGTTETVGTISFSRPTLYVFPAGDGGRSLFFGVRDMSVICDGGVGRRPAFWDFARHFGYVDVLIATNAGADNIFALQSFVERQRSGELLQLSPRLGYVMFNGAPDAAATKQSDSPTLLVHLPEEVTRLTSMLHDVGIPPQIGASPVGGKTAQKINLYQKVSGGSLDLYVTHPVEDCRELKEFRRQSASHAANFVSGSAVPLTDMVSIVAAMVWKPHALTEKPVRILVPGSAPLVKLYEGLDRLQGMPLFESLSGLAEEPAQPLTQHAAKPGTKPTRPVQRPSPQLAAASKPQAPVQVKARDRAAGSVGSPRGSREAASRKPVVKTEPASKTGRVAKPTVSDEKVKHAEHALSSKAAVTSQKTSPVDAELPVFEVTIAEGSGSIHGVKVDEPGEHGLEEIAARDSVERDSLEASAGDDVLVDSLCGDDKGYSEVHSEDELDPNKSGKVEQTADSSYGERDVNVRAERVELDIDDRIIPGSDNRVSPTLDVGIHERVEPECELGTPSSSTKVVAESVEAPSIPSDDHDPLCNAGDHGLPLDNDNLLCAFVLSRPVDVADVDVESLAKQTASDEAMDTKQSEMQQEMADDIVERDERAIEQHLQVNVDDEHSADLLSGLHQSPTTRSVPDEPTDELEDTSEADVGHNEATVNVEFADEPGSDVLPSFQQSPTAQTSKLEPANEVDDRDQPEDIETEYTDVSKEPKREMDENVEAVAADSGVIPQGLPSPQKEAEWLEVEQGDSEADGVMHDENVDHGHRSLKSDEDGTALAPSPSSEDDDDKLQQDHDSLLTSLQHRGLESFDEAERQESHLVTGASSVETHSASQKRTEEPTEEPHSLSTHVVHDKETEEEMADEAEHCDPQPESEVDPADFCEEVSPNTHELPLEESYVKQLKTVMQEESECVAPRGDDESQVQLAQTQELPSPRVTSDGSETEEETIGEADYHDPQPVVDVAGFCDDLSPPLDESCVKELKTETREESGAPCSDDDSHDHLAQTQDLPSLRVTSEDNETEEEITADAGHLDAQPVVDSAGLCDDLSPDSDEPPLEELDANELKTEPQDESAAGSHVQVPQTPELPSSTVNRDAFDVDEKIQESPHQTEASKQPLYEECPVDYEPSETHEQLSDDVAGYGTAIPDAVDTPDDVPISPVEHLVQDDVSKDSERPSFCYTEPHIQLTEDFDHAPDAELPTCAADAADDGQTEDPLAESSSPDLAEEPFDPIKSWGSPLGLPAPLGNDNRDGGKKRESKESGARGAAVSSAKDRGSQATQKADAKTASAGKKGAAQDLSGGQNGRTSARSGKPAERPAAARKSGVAAAGDAKKVGIYLHLLDCYWFLIEHWCLSVMLVIRASC